MWEEKEVKYLKENYKRFTNKEFYLNRGFSEKESYSMLKDRQTTFSKKICIEKYGEIEGVMGKIMNID